MLLKFFSKSVQKILRTDDCMYTVALAANCKFIKSYRVGVGHAEFRYLVRDPVLYLYVIYFVPIHSFYILN